MKILKKIETVVKKTDFFYSKEMLRYDDDEDYKTLTGGIVSLGIIVAIVIGFASMILSTLNRTTISTSTQIIKNVIPPASILEITPESSFRFAVEIWRFNLSDTKRYFDTTFRVDYQVNSVVVESVNLPLQTCTKEFFADYPDIISGFEKLEIGGWLCPPLNTTLNLYGKYSSQSYSQYIITIEACKNDTDPSRPCASPEQIKQFFVDNSNQLYFTLYFTNPQINPDEKQYKNYYFEDMSYVIFGSQVGSQTFISFADYTVETDDSIWPYEHIIEDNGCIVRDIAVNHPFQTNINGTYANFNLVKSPDSIIYTRQVQKLSTVFSFIGGMIGAVSAVLFILKIYTSLAFQFSISLEIFKKRSASQQKIEEQTDKGNNSDQLSMNLFNFVRYYAFAFAKFIGKPCDWPAMKYADECKQQISKQLDIKLLLKRIIFLEHCITHMIQDYQLDALQMSKPLMPSEIKAIREKCESIIDNENSVHQQQARSELKEQSELSQIQNCLKNENILNSPASFVDTLSKNLSALKQSSTFLKPKKCSIDISTPSPHEQQKQNKITIVEIGSKQIGEELYPYLQMMKGKGGLRVENSNNLKKKQNRRSSYLMQLQKSALEGNHISSKIWKQIGNTLKRIQPDT